MVVGSEWTLPERFCCSLFILRLISLCWPVSSLMRRPFSLLPVSLILAGAVALPGMVQASAEIPADKTESSASPEISTKVVLLLGRREISVIRDGEKLGPWPVAIGDPRTPTPTGVFKVENKVTNPQYQSTKSGRVNPAIGVASPLGDRWIGFLQSGQNQFGIHGTPWPYWVNAKAAVTNGCVRMLHAHVRQLFDVVEVGTTVEILR